MKRRDTPQLQCKFIFVMVLYVPNKVHVLVIKFLSEDLGFVQERGERDRERGRETERRRERKGERGREGGRESEGGRERERVCA